MDATTGGHEKYPRLAVADPEQAGARDRAAASALNLTYYSQFVVNNRPDWQRS
ncbi:hypothetical protein [Cryobacterium sp. CG_9.6]|uniref:hypothetical protein n=1 Tax=Cryobacterium sp. CG_9.6 TaxID=2760710 RepID=UPI002474FEBE|nr:hypothetical protein [Cryobacterium sp. CG_9.6]MDH6237117.1 hypothetical protein [Cryobacterium sp. CG_9.6]